MKYKEIKKGDKFLLKEETGYGVNYGAVFVEVVGDDSDHFLCHWYYILYRNKNNEIVSKKYYNHDWIERNTISRLPVTLEYVQVGDVVTNMDDRDRTVLIAMNGCVLCSCMDKVEEAGVWFTKEEIKHCTLSRPSNRPEEEVKEMTMEEATAELSEALGKTVKIVE